METYKINIETSRLPDSLGRLELVLISASNPRNGEYLSRGKYHVTVINKDGGHEPGHTLCVLREKEVLSCALDHPEVGFKTLSEKELSDLSFIFMPNG